MAQYQEKARFVDAIRFLGVTFEDRAVVFDQPAPDWIKVGASISIDVTAIVNGGNLKLLGGSGAEVFPGDWIVRDDQGVIARLTDGEFHAAYELPPSEEPELPLEPTEPGEETDPDEEVDPEEEAGAN